MRPILGILLLSCILLQSTVGPKLAAAESTDPEVGARDPRLVALEKFLLAQLDPVLGLVRESPDLSINRTYWLLGDNLLAYHALKDRHPDIASQIYQTMQRYGYFQDGLHEALFGNEIPLPPLVPQVVVVDQTPSYAIKTEDRSNSTDSSLMDDWTDYADILLYAALGFYNQPAHVRQLDKALYYFGRARDMWNEAGLYDRPARLDGYYTTHKLALLLFCSLVLNETLPFRSTLDDRIWRFQRGDGGIRSHYRGNLTSDREANTETASLVLIAYNYEEIKLARELQSEKERQAEAQARAEDERERLFMLTLSVVAVTIAAIALGFLGAVIKLRHEKQRNIKPTL